MLSQTKNTIVRSSKALKFLSRNDIAAVSIESFAEAEFASSPRFDGSIYLTRRNTMRPAKYSVSENENIGTRARLSLSRSGEGWASHSRYELFLIARPRQVNSALKFFSHRKRFLRSFSNSTSSRSPREKIISPKRTSSRGRTRRRNPRFFFPSFCWIYFSCLRVHRMICCKRWYSRKGAGYYC